MIITVAGYKGGIGKSTISVHVAAYMAQKASTLLVDGDANRSVLAWANRCSLTITKEKEVAIIAGDRPPGAVNDKKAQDAE